MKSAPLSMPMTMPGRTVFANYRGWTGSSANCPASFSSSVGEISCPSFCPADAPIRPRRGGMPLPHAACLGAHTVANCWLQPQLHQTASEGRYCGARTFAAFSPMAPALPHTTKQCTRAAAGPFSACCLQRLSRDCAGLRSPRFVLRLSKGPLGIGQGTPNRLWLPTFKVPLTSMWTGHHAFSSSRDRSRHTATLKQIH